ncbi:MAG: DUF3667 domain-containing protein [Bacteroidales bacterium]|nr:DUF3667 domain-containing protein [Bacteroidales bacterium]
MKKHRFAVRRRAFVIWQKLGYLPWSKKKAKSRKGDFYKGAFDSIPFLNDDAKRTFVHLLLRPGYMIRDYIKGQHEQYLAPLTSLIIFYAFFALISSIVNPDYSSYHNEARGDAKSIRDSVMVELAAENEHANSLLLDINTLEVTTKAHKVLGLINLLDLDRHPERVDTPAKASLAAFEGALRSQGVYLFLGQFLLLWCAMCFALRKKGMSKSACAAATAYILCQFCFFMFFSLFFSSKGKGEIGIGLMAILLTIDYSQLFGINWKNGLKLTVKTGLWYVLALLFLIALLIAAISLYILLAGN